MSLSLVIHVLGNFIVLFVNFVCYSVYVVQYCTVFSAEGQFPCAPCSEQRAHGLTDAVSGLDSKEIRSKPVCAPMLLPVFPGSRFRRSSYSPVCCPPSVITGGIYDHEPPQK